MRTWQINPEFLQAPLIDIGAGKGPIDFPGATLWDKEQGDATEMAGVPDASFQTVYSHHCLEHIDRPAVALANWWRILRPTGYLLVTVPSWRYYEKRKRLPSIFNSDHRTFWDLDQPQPPDIRSLLHTARTAIPDGELISLRVCKDGYVELPPDQQSPDGFHLEITLLKH